MKVLITATLALASSTLFGQMNHPPSHDRVYSADQTSNTVSVIDPGQNKLLGVIKLGDPLPASLSPLYKGALLVHGLGFSPDSKTLAVVSIGSNSVTLIDTTTNKTKGTLYVGRSPHEAFFTPDGKELWVSVRGEDYIAVIDPAQMKETRRIQVANGPGMLMFRPDGKYAFLCSSFTPEIDVIETAKYAVVQRLTQGSPFCPNIAVTPDGKEFWLTLKDAGKTQAFRAEPPFNQIALLETGAITNHVNFVDNKNGKFAYITIGGTNEVKVYRRGEKPELVATIPVGELPHGIWPSGDGSRVYIALENGSAVQAIDTLSNKVIATIPIGQTAQALVYVPNAVPTGDGTDNLQPLGKSGETTKLTMVAPAASKMPAARASVAVNSMGVVDLLEIAASGLQPNSEYKLSLVSSLIAPLGEMQPLATLKTKSDGAAIAQAIGPIKKVVTDNKDSGPQTQRYLVVTSVDQPKFPVLVQAR
ncbi:MAG: YncE family protein [Terriglobales bacterium]